MNSKLRIRIGDVEIDCEGTEDFLRKELPELLRTAMELHKAAGTGAIPEGVGADSSGKEKLRVPALTTSTIAAKLKSKSGPTLLLAAAAHLILVKEKQTFTRQELLSEMKSASAYFKKSYSNNLTSYLKGAITEGRVRETAKNAYALSAEASNELETQLADS